MKKIVIEEGEILNNYGISFIKDLQPHIEQSGRKRRYCLFKCHCGKNFSSVLQDVKSERRTSCGCRKGSKPKEYQKGDLINGVKFIKTLGTINYQQKAIFECPLCGDDWESLVGNIQIGNSKSCCGLQRGWTRTEWIALSSTSILYKIRLFNENENFIKFGITSKNLKERLKTIPYNYEILKYIKGESGYIFDLEKRIIRFYKKYKYEPIVDFGGKTECFIIN